MSENKKILIVDDDARNRKLLETLVRADGYGVHSVDSGKAALTHIASEVPDLVLLDLMMPGMDGFEVVRLLKNDVHTCDIPIVMLTALDDASSRMRLLATGVAGMLSKPVDRWQLKELIEQLLGGTE